MGQLEWNDFARFLMREHDNGVIELHPANPRATVCGTCRRGWDDTVSTSVTPTPSGRCPWEDEHTYEEDDN